MALAIKTENISKAYQLGEIGTGTLSRDLERWWARRRGKEDPMLKLGEENDRTKAGGTDVVWSLKDINFEINQGEAVGIIGRNGAGKSTLLKILSRITSPTSGTIKVRGRVASLLEVGTGFHPELTGRENIYLNGAILGMRKREIKRKLDEIIEFSGVIKYIDTPVKRYSSGMYVRLAFAVAAHLESEILVIDEVLAVGDAEFQKKCLGKMDSVSKNEGRTVLFVSHNLAAVSALCKSAILLNNGQLALRGSVNDVLKQYVESKQMMGKGRIVFDGKEPERFGEKGYAKWKSVTLLDSKSQITGTFVMGEKMVIKLDLDIFRTSKDFEIGVGIGNFHEVFLHYLVSPWEGFTEISKLGHNTLMVEIPKVLLFPGHYILNIWICVRGAYYDDAVHNAISFTVEEGKLNDHDTYFQRFSKNTQVYTPSKWQLGDV